MAGEPATPLLETRALSGHIDGQRVVDEVSWAFASGTLTAIVGAAGAGKTSYLDLISGQRRASAGSVWLRGRDITTLPVPVRARRGIGRAFQQAQAFGLLSVVENVRLAVQARRGEAFQLGSLWNDHRNTLERAHALVERVGLGERADEPAGGLVQTEPRRLEPAMLMALEPSVYLFDAPTAGLGAREAAVLMDLIRALKHQRDKAIVLVEQRIDVVREVADRIVVLHAGRQGHR